VIYVLLLNDMRSANIENLTPVAWADSGEALGALVDREQVEPYREPGENRYGPITWGKSFRKNGPLEWYNLPSVHGGYGGIQAFPDLVVIDGVPHYPPRPIDVPNVAQVIGAAG
jgi:hypothetical protein